MKNSKIFFQKFLLLSVVLCIAFLIGIFIDGRLQLVEARTTTVDGIDFITVPRDSLASDSSGNNKGLYAVYSDGTIMPAEGPIDHGPHASGGSAPCYYQDQLGLWAGKWDIWGIFDETLTGYVYASVTGTYKFLLSADDQAWLTFNGAPFITTPYNAHAIATIDLVGGTWYPIQIRYQNRSGSNWFSFWWNVPVVNDSQSTLIGITATDLVMINPSNPTDVKIIGPHNLASTLISGLTYNPANGKLFSIIYAQDRSNQYLVELDKQTGHSTVIATLGDPNVIGYFEALEYVPELNTLVASHSTTPGSVFTNQLVQLKTDGSFTPLASAPPDNDYCGYDSIRKKFYTTDPNGSGYLVNINLATGAQLNIGTINSTLGDLAFVADRDTFFALNEQDNNLYQLKTTDGGSPLTSTLVGTISGNHVLAIAAVNVSSTPTQPRTALLDLDPDIFSVTTGGFHTMEITDNLLKAYIELSDTTNPSDVAADTVTLLSNGVEIAKAQSSVIKDKVLEFSFPLTTASVSTLLGLDATWVGVDSRFINVDAAILPVKTIDLLNLTVAGSLKNGDTFTAADAVQVIQGKKEDPIISATVNIHPEALNTCSRSDKNAVTVRIELPSEYHEQDIDLSSIRMSTAANDEPSIAAQQQPGCISHEGNALMVKFNRQQVIGLVAGADNLAILKVRGTIADRAFEGFDSIKIINKEQCGNKCNDKD